MAREWLLRATVTLRENLMVTMRAITQPISAYTRIATRTDISSCDWLRPRWAADEDQGNQNGSLERASSVSTSGFEPALSWYCQTAMVPGQPVWLGE